MRHSLIHLLDWLDDKVLRHSLWGTVCQWIGCSPWWDLNPGCGRCARNRGEDA